MNNDFSLLVFADDWGRHPSSCQHLVRELLPHHPVCWVNTIGTRAPRLDWATLARGGGKLKQWLAPSAPANILPNNLQLACPKMWPWFRTSLDRWLNRQLLSKQLIPWLRRLPKPPIAVTTLPLVADILDDLPVRRWVYYCVDDFSVWPGLEQAAIGRMERKLVGRMDDAIAASETLQFHLANLGRASSLLTHGVDLDFWRQPGEPLAALQALPRPLVMFFGLIDRRLELAFLRRLGESMTEGALLLIGPQDNPDPALYTLPRVALHPALPFPQLPAAARMADVLVMPYADLPVTRAMQPLKLKEYLATEKPVVVRDLPANQAWADCLDLCESAGQFASLVQQRCSTGVPHEQRRARLRLESETWAEKARQFAHVVDG
jgi:hypothetical protein